MRSHVGALGWLAYGGIVSLLFQGTLRARAPIDFTCSRLTDLTLAVRALNHGAPPLLALLPGAGGLYPAGYADDVGPFLYLAPLGHILGITNPYTLYRIEFVALWTVALLVWPLVFSQLFRSRLAGLLAPLLLMLYVVEDSTATNQYWVPGWAVAVCLPLLMLAAERARSGRRDATTWLLVGGAVVVAGFANTMRSSSGYGILIAGLALAVVIMASWRRRLLAAISVLGVFWLASSGVISAAVAYRNAVDGRQPLAQAFTANLGGTTVDSIGGTAHPFWHTAYIGLGFDRNKYGIYYSDSSAYNYVLSLHPGAKADSPVESATLSKRYFHLLSTDPGFVLGGYLHKAGVALDMAVQDSLLLLVLVPCALLASARRRQLVIWLALFLPSLVVLLAVPTIVIPGNGYQFGFLNCVRVLMVVLICWIAAEIELALTRRARPGAPSWLDRIRARYLDPYLPTGTVRPGAVGNVGQRLEPSHLVRRAPSLGRSLARAIPRRWALVTALLVATEIAASVGASAVAAHEKGALQFASVRPGESRQILAGHGVLRWVPSPSGVVGWGLANRATLSSVTPDGKRDRRAASITSTNQRWAYQVVGPTLTLPGGTYQLFIRGSARRRGIALIAIDPDTNVTLAVSRYPPGTDTGSGWGLKFMLPSQATVHFVLANNGGSALWNIRAIELGRAPAGLPIDNVNASSQACDYAPPQPGALRPPVEAPLPAVTGTAFAWNAADIQTQWQPQAGASTTGSAKRLIIVHTSPAPYGFQLASPVLGPSPGNYLLQVTGTVASGGLEILAQVPGTETFIAKRSFGSGLPDQGPVTMALPFHLPESEALQFVLANSTTSGSARTRWTISRIVLSRTR
jgi:hypothetical protein